MNAIIEQLKASWQVMGEKARRAFKRYAVFTLVTVALLIVMLVVVEGMLAFNLWPFQLDAFQAFYLYIGIMVAEIIYLIVMLIILSSAYKAIKRDYFARAFPGEAFVEQNHWSKKDAFLLYAGLVGLVGFIPNITSIIVELTNIPDIDLMSILTSVIWLGITVWAVPRCCDRYLSPGPRLDDSSASGNESDKQSK